MEEVESSGCSQLYYVAIPLVLVFVILVVLVGAIIYLAITSAGSAPL